MALNHSEMPVLGLIVDRKRLAIRLSGPSETAYEKRRPMMLTVDDTDRNTQLMTYCHLVSKCVCYCDFRYRVASISDPSPAKMYDDFRRKGFPNLWCLWPHLNAALLRCLECYPKQDESETTDFTLGAATWRTGRNIRIVFDSGLFLALY